MNPIVIIGSGLAGYNTAKELRKLDTTTPLVIISSDSGAFYSKPTLSNALASKKTPAAIALSAPQQMAAQLNATVRVQTRIDAIDTASHRLHIGDEMLAYSKLVLALGADQIRLPISGDAAGDIMTVNDLDDYARFRTAIDGKKRVVIIGAGLIGCEFANDLAAAGYGVDVIDIAQQRLAPGLAQIGESAASGAVERRVARQGFGHFISQRNQVCPISAKPVQKHDDRCWCAAGCRELHRARESLHVYATFK